MFSTDWVQSIITIVFEITSALLILLGNLNGAIKMS